MPDETNASTTSAKLTAGDAAPDFTLLSQMGSAPISLSDYRGRSVVIYFYPKD